MANNIYKLIKNPNSKLIDELSKNSIEYNGGRDCPYQYIHNKLKWGKEPDLVRFLKVIAKQKTTIFDDIDYVKALELFLKYKEQWVRPITTWKKKFKSRERQFEDIINHLFVKYEMPKFMYKSWFWSGNTLYTDQIQWFIDIGAGKNIRKSKDVPIKLTKKMAHVFMSAPDNFTPKEAIRFAQITDMGGNMRNIRGVMTSKIGNDFKNNDFWITVIKFFINNPMLDIQQYNPIVDYIQMMKYQTRSILVDGNRRVLKPEKENFSMKDRDVNTLINNVDKWHNNLTKRKGSPTHWEPAFINDFKYVTGKDEMKQTFSISQITTAKDLSAEGKALNHCVGSYVNSCANGRCSIYSMTVNSFIKYDTRLLTIEVNKEGVISEIRGKSNRLPNAYEMRLIDKWAFNEKLTKSKWLL